MMMKRLIELIRCNLHHPLSPNCIVYAILYSCVLSLYLLNKFLMK
jgi:hypothetical protein